MVCMLAKKLHYLKYVICLLTVTAAQKESERHWQLINAPFIWIKRYLVLWQSPQFIFNRIIGNTPRTAPVKPYVYCTRFCACGDELEQFSMSVELISIVKIDHIDSYRRSFSRPSDISTLLCIDVPQWQSVLYWATFPQRRLRSRRTEWAKWVCGSSVSDSLIDSAIFSMWLLRNCKMPEVETCRASTVWYEDNAHIFSSEKVDRKYIKIYFKK